MLGMLGLPGHSRGVHSTACWGRRAGHFPAYRWPRQTAATEQCGMSSPSGVQPYRFLLCSSFLTEAIEKCGDESKIGWGRPSLVMCIDKSSPYVKPESNDPPPRGRAWGEQ